jgi:hypothetical protein
MILDTTIAIDFASCHDTKSKIKTHQVVFGATI